MNDYIAVTICLVYLIGIGYCSYRLSDIKKKCNCFGRKSSNIQNDEYTLV